MISRSRPYENDPAYQRVKRLTRDEVPPLPNDAVPFSAAASVGYDKGRQRWRTKIGDKTKILTYILYRDQADIDAGAHPWLELYTDGSL